MKRRIFSVLLSSALLLTALAGCGQGGEAAPSGSSSDADSETGTRDELIFVNYRDIRDLNPHLYAGEMYAQSILYDTLVSNTEDGYVGCLAEDWTISDDGRIYTFNIRDGVTFSDGTPCDANAILANFNAILENRERHTWLEMMNLLVGVSAPDEDTFVIEMSEPYYPMLTELACIRPFAMISPNCMIDGSTMNGVNGYIGTGPYVLTDFVTDEYAVFERNENYWGEAPAIQKITVKVIPDNQTRIMALENEEIDLIFGKNMLDADAISQYVDSDRFTVSLSDPTSTRHIVLNTTHDILGDTAVRKALQHATNRQAISEGIFYGLEPAADTLYSPTVPYCDVDLEPYAYDTEEAARLLDEAGWVMGSDGGRSKNGQKLELDLLYNSDSVTEKTISEYLQSEYLKLGISLNIHGEEEQSYPDRIGTLYINSGIPAVCFPNVLAQYPAQDAALYRAFRGMSRQEAGQALYDSYLPLFPEAALQSRDFRDSMGSDLRNIGQEAKLQEAPWGFKLSEVRCPVVLLHGTADSEVPYSAMEETAKELPHARIIKLEGEEHASPAITDRLMEELLQQDKV